jgi:hypothetical protein
MANFQFLLDNDVRHLASVLPDKQTVLLEDIGLNKESSDEEIVAAASANRLVIVTNNRRDFKRTVADRIRQSTKKPDGCTQVHGLVIVRPSQAINQLRLLAAASKKLIFEGEHIGWKTVFERCLMVEIEASGTARVSKLPRCPFCPVFAQEKAS